LSRGEKDYGTFGNANQEAPVVEEETRSRGSVNTDVYWKYIRAGSNYWILPLFVFLALGSQAIYTTADYLLAIW